jgi:uncharacterized membrane protein
MTLFQMSSASLDSVSYAACALVAALFMRGCDKGFEFTKAMHAALIICLFALATSRQNLFVFTLLPALLYRTRRSRVYLISSAVLFSVSLAWALYAFENVHGLRTSELPTAEITAYRLTHLGSSIGILFATLLDAGSLRFYWCSFVGILGCLDTLLPNPAYIAFGVLLVTLGVLSAERSWQNVYKMPTAALLLGVAVAVALIFAILLITWTPPRASVIEGIQGRYFIPVVIFLGYALFNRSLPAAHRRLGSLIVFTMMTVSIWSVSHALVQRYWLMGSIEVLAR